MHGTDDGLFEFEFGSEFGFGLKYTSRSRFKFTSKSKLSSSSSSSSYCSHFLFMPPPAVPGGYNANLASGIIYSLESQ
jgi:hypothetical protein